MELLKELIIFKLQNLSEAEKLSGKVEELVNLAYNYELDELALNIEENYY